MTSSAARVDLVERYGWLPNVVALQIAARLPVRIDVDDLRQDGFVGLVDAVRKYSADRGVPFEVYAKFRVRGAILDGLRDLDWASRHTRLLQKQLFAVLDRLNSELGRKPELNEIAETLGVDVTEASRRMQISGIGNISASTRSEAHEDLPPPDLEANAKEAPDAICAQNELRAAIERAIQQLPKQYQRVIRLYHFSGMQMKKIGEGMGVTECRISHINKRALRRMKEALLAEGIASAGELLWR